MPNNETDCLVAYGRLRENLIRYVETLDVPGHAKKQILKVAYDMTEEKCKHKLHKLINMMKKDIDKL